MLTSSPFGNLVKILCSWGAWHMKTRINHSKIHYYCSNNQNLRVRIAVTYISFLVMLPCQTELLLGLGLGDSWSSLTPHLHCSFVSKPILTGPWEKSQDQAINTLLSSGLFSDQGILLTCNWFGDYHILALYHALWTLFCPKIDVKTQKGAISPTFKRESVTQSGSTYSNIKENL